MAIVAAALSASAASAATTTYVGSDLLFDPGVPAIAAPYPSSITVANETGFVEDVDVSLRDFTHLSPEHVDIFLSGPSGAKVMLVSDQGASGDANETDLTLDDEAAGPVPDPAVTGTYHPTNINGGDPDTFPDPAPPGAFSPTLSVFDFTEPNGRWRLWARDDTNGDGGDIEGWRLILTTRGPRPVNVPLDQGFREGAGVVNVTITRESGRAGSINYETGSFPLSTGGNASARPGTDYTPAFGTLNFAEGETVKTFPLTILNDQKAERREIVGIMFSAATGDMSNPAPPGAALPLRLEDDEIASPAARPKVSAARIQRILRQRGLIVFGTPKLDGRVEAKATIRLPGANRSASVRLPKVDAIARAGERVRLKLAVPRKSLRALRRALRLNPRKMTANVRVTATDDAQRKTTTTRRIRLRR